MNTEWSKTTKHIVGVGLALFGLYVLYLSRPVLPVLIIAALLSFLLMPVVGFFHHRLRIPRGLAILFSLLLMLLLILLSPLVFIPPIIDGFNFLAKVDYQILIESVLDWMKTTLLSMKSTGPQFLGLQFDLDSIIDPALELLRDTEADISPTLPSFGSLIDSLRSAVIFTYGVATNVAGTVFAGVLALIITLLSIIYFSLDAHKFANWFLNVVPEPHRPEIAKLAARLVKTWRAYFRGQLNLMIIIGVITWIGNTAIGLPGSFPLAVIAGVMELIPNLGPFLAAVPAVIVALLQGSTYLGISNFTFALIVIGLYILIQQIENTFVVPRVLGDAVDLHPLVVLVGVVVGANVAGILGALLAAPVIASVREIVSYLYAKMLGEDPYPPQPEEPDRVKSSWLENSKLLYAKGRQIVGRMPMHGARPVDNKAQADTTPDN